MKTKCPQCGKEYDINPDETIKEVTICCKECGASFIVSLDKSVSEENPPQGNNKKAKSKGFWSTLFFMVKFVLVGIIIFGLIGVAGWYYIKQKDKEELISTVKEMMIKEYEKDSVDFSFIDIEIIDTKGNTHEGIMKCKINDEPTKIHLDIEEKGGIIKVWCRPILFD